MQLPDRSSCNYGSNWKGESSPDMNKNHCPEICLRGSQPVASTANANRNVVKIHETNLLPTCKHLHPYLSPPLVSGLSGAGAELLTLPLLLPAVDPSSALRSRNPVQRSASDSLVAGGSLKNSVESDGVLGVRWNGDTGKRKLLFDVPGLARPACSFCSSVQLRSAAISWRI